LQAARLVQTQDLAGACRGLVVYQLGEVLVGKATQANLAAAQNGSLDAQVKAAASTVTAARQKLNSDQVKLDVASQGPTDQDIQQAESRVDQAVQALALAQQPSSQHDIDAQRATVESARQSLAKAQQPYTAADLQQQQDAVSSSEASVQKAQNPSTEQDARSAEAAVAQAEGALAASQLSLDNARVIAPIDGTVGDLQVTAGGIVGTTTALMTIVPANLEVLVNVEESQFGQVAPGQTVELDVSAFPNQPFEAKVQSINPSIDTRTRTAGVHIVPTNPAGKLRSGMSSTVVIQTARADNAIVVPTTALQQRNGQQYVYTDVNDRAKLQIVQIGLANATVIQITSGIQAGDTVILPGSTTITDGVAVVPATQPLTTGGVAPVVSGG